MGPTSRVDGFEQCCQCRSGKNTWLLLSMKCKTENWTWIFTAETVTPVKFYKKVPVISFGPMEAVNPTDTTEDSILNSGDTKRTKLAVMIFYDWQGREFYLVGKSLNGIFADEKGDKR